MNEAPPHDAGGRGDAGAGAATDGIAVLLVTDVYPPGCGGSGWSTHALAQVLAAHGHPVEVVSLDPSRVGLTQRVFEDINIVELGLRRERRSPLRRLGRRDYAHDALQRYLEARLDSKPAVQLVHAQHLHSGPPAVAAAARCGLGSVVTLRDYWPVCLHGTSWWNREECPGCTTANLAGCMREYRRWPAPIARLMVPWARRRLAARRTGIESAGQIITVSRWVQQRVERELKGARYVVLPNMVDADGARAAARSAASLDLPFDGDYLMAAGKLAATKGFDRLLATLGAAASELPLVIAGDGPEQEHLRRQAKGMPFEGFFPGWVPHVSLLRLISGARALLLPSAWNEPLSRLLIESMALGTPVITWRSGGNPEHLESGVDAFVVDTVEDLRHALADLARPGRVREVGAAGERTARQRFAPSAVYPKLMEIYDVAMRSAGEPVGRGGTR